MHRPSAPPRPLPTPAAGPYFVANSNAASAALSAGSTRASKRPRAARSSCLSVNGAGVRQPVLRACEVAAACAAFSRASA